MCVVHIFFYFTRASLSNTPICRHCFYTYLIYYEFYPAKGCTVNETDQVDRYACMCMFVLFVAVFMYTYIERERVFFSLFQFFFPSSLTLKHTHIRTQEGNSCLHIFAAQGSNEILRILLHAGAKVSAKNEVDR